jgi:lipopolysaccharide transport protein LptA/LPS export ABC transporter protein LptC
MNRRSVIVYLASAFIIVVILLSGYFFMHKPDRVQRAPIKTDKRFFVFNGFKHQTEKNGVVNWEIRARTMKKYIDKPTVTLEGIEGEYRPKADAVVFFKAANGEMDMDKKVGVVKDVEILYKGDYRLKSHTMDLDFMNSTASKRGPVDLTGKKFTLMGVGLQADTKEQIITIQKDVSGTIERAKGGKFKFSADRFTYLMKDTTYVFEGNVVVKGDDMNMICDKVNVRSQGDDVQQIDAVGHVKILAKGTIAKSERAVYYVKDEKVVLRESPKIIRDNGVEMEGETVVYSLSTGKFSVDKPRVRLQGKT